MALELRRCVSRAVMVGLVLGAAGLGCLRTGLDGAAPQGALSPLHQRMIAQLRANAGAGSNPALCFAPGTDNEVIAAFNGAMAEGQPVGFNAGGRWGATAYSPAGGAGSPTVITYSFVPDGTSLPSLSASDPAGTSNLFARMRQIYGTDAAWQAHFHSVFTRWGQLCGITYIHEANDDGIAVGQGSVGVINVRGDVRIGGNSIDGNGNVLAFNHFPANGGDMVLDTNDTFFNTTTNNSRRLRNVVAHEHGHGMGQQHVCPINQTKLMEPFVSTGYDGPRHDDVRLAQAYYGDIHERNNSAEDATDLGALASGATITVGTPPAPAIPDTSTVSLSAWGDQDWYKFAVDSPRMVTVTLTPVGASYDSSEQACGGSGSCCSGNVIDSSVLQNLNVQLIGPDGAAVLGTAAGAPAGGVETLTLPLNTPGVYYARVYPPTLTTDIEDTQMYLLTVGAGTEAVTVTAPSGTPSLVSAGSGVSFPVTVTTTSGTVASAELLYRASASGAWASAPLSFVSGSAWTATLPAFACGQTPQFYVRAVSSTGLAGSSPATAPTAFYSAGVGALTGGLTDDFETDQGWAVSNGAGLSGGAWVRNDPNGTNAQPENDVSAAGTRCWFTGQGAVGGGVNAADVDGGATTLTSPAVDLSGFADGRLTYWRWYSATDAADSFVAQISGDNGQTWATLETLTTHSTGWVQREFTLSQLPIVLSSQGGGVRVRFTAADGGADSTVEAAVDEVRLAGLACAFTPAACAGAWELVAASGPSARTDAAMAFDTVRGRLVMVGGSTAGGVSGETWEFSPVSGAWTLASTGGPSARTGAAMTFDSGRGVCVLYGGIDAGGNASDQTWEWNGSTWNHRASVRPFARYDHAMTFDSVRGQVLMFGGRISPAGYQRESWDWDGATWTNRLTPQPPASPAARIRPGFVYDPVNARAVLIGGLTASGTATDTWLWNNTTHAWTGVTPAGAQPTARHSHAVVWDAARQRVLLFGGDDGTSAMPHRVNDTWEWNGTAWSQRLGGGGGGPTPRSGAAIAHDPSNGTTYLFGGVVGGAGSTTMSGELWRLVSPVAPSVTAQPQAARACNGPAVVTVGAAGTPVGYQWQIADGQGGWVNLADGEFPVGSPRYTVSGATAGTLSLSPSFPVGSDVVRAVVSNTCGTAVSGEAGVTVVSSDFNGDGDFGTDGDIEAFFACLGGSCCPTCGGSDFNGDGDIGTDQDIEYFFRVLGGGC
ncbi:MAG TPA: matrixin family metalloprotease [Phycisphaerales bacterium]|nr:matrixin family metalloprotease [Phycisphaerales bacterium]